MAVSRRIAELSDLTGRGAIVAGGAGHLGTAAAAALLELGARVAIVDRDRDGCDRAVAGLGPGAVGVPCDLSDEGATRAAVR